MINIKTKPASSGNQSILAVTTVLFTLFVIAEVVGALAGHSLSLLGDAAAMSVDVFTYMANMYAEYVKSKGQTIALRDQYIIEVIIPSFSIIALLSITGYVCSEAIDIILDPAEEDDNVSIVVLFVYASVNMAIDVISFVMFYLKRNTAFTNSPIVISLPPSVLESFIDDNNSNNPASHSLSPLPSPAIIVHGDQKPSNLNMISAFTHVAGDTLRTLSVFAAAIIASTTSVPGYICDAWAAVAATATIGLIVTPIMKEIYLTVRRLNGLNASSASNVA